MGDEVRLGRGFMFWGVKLQLTEEGQHPGRLEGLLGAVHDALAVSGWVGQNMHILGGWRDCWGRCTMPWRGSGGGRAGCNVH